MEIGLWGCQRGPDTRRNGKGTGGHPPSVSVTSGTPRGGRKGGKAIRSWKRTDKKRVVFQNKNSTGTKRKASKGGVIGGWVNTSLDVTPGEKLSNKGEGNYTTCIKKHLPGTHSKKKKG